MRADTGLNAFWVTVKDSAGGKDSIGWNIYVRDIADINSIPYFITTVKDLHDTINVGERYSRPI